MKVWIFLSVVIMICISLNAFGMEERQATKCIIVHHSATKNGDVESFRRYHVNKRGWEDIGYHFVIRRDGKIERGRKINLVGAHAKRRNSDSIGICLVGEDSFTPKQIYSLRKLIADLCRKYPGITIIERHHEKCPGSGINPKVWQILEEAIR